MLHRRRDTPILNATQITRMRASAAPAFVAVYRQRHCT